MMFVKLIVLIVALGSTGVGVLSVRQSRLVASNEMTQSRMRSRQLTQRSMELRAQISQSITPDQIRAMLGEDIDTTMVDQTHHNIKLLDPSEPEPESTVPAEQDDPTATNTNDSENYWTLSDGTRIKIINPKANPNPNHKE
jgi:hypothetical protein